METKLLNCSCSNSYQNEKYNGKRVCNKTIKLGEYKCTSCGKIVKTTNDK
jgi:hypothetical protein